MVLKKIRKAGKKCVLWAGVGTALALALCKPGEYGAFADDTVVVEDIPEEGIAPVEEPAVADAGAPAGTDPAKIEGLFEVAGEQSDSSGASAEEESEGVAEGEKGNKDKDKGKGKDKDKNSKKEGKDKDKDDSKDGNGKEERKLIVGYRQVGVQASIHFEMGEKPSLASLQQQFPSSLDVYFLGEKEPQRIPVTWESYGDDYSSTNLNYYFFTPKFDPQKYAVKGMNLQSESPYIEVIQNAFTFEMIESAPPKENEAAVYQYCRKVLHLNTAAACGILSNIYCESGFRTNAIGDSGTSVGLCQWHNSRWTNLRNYAPDTWQTLDGQLSFMRFELLGRYNATLKYIRNVSDDEQGAYDAAYYWCMHYEMPDRLLSRSTTRGYLAKNVYWKRYGLGEGEAETETEEFGTETEAEEEKTTQTEPETEDMAQTEEESAAQTEPETEAEEENTTQTEQETERTAETEEVNVRQTEPETEHKTETRQEEETEKETGAEETEKETEEAETETETEEAEEAETETEAETEAEEAETGTEAETETETESEKSAMDDFYAGRYRCISDNGLNIREDRSTEVEVAGFIPFDEIAAVHSADGEWASVTYGDQNGYSKLEYLEKIPDETEAQENLEQSRKGSDR